MDYYTYVFFNQCCIIVNKLSASTEITTYLYPSSMALQVKPYSIEKTTSTPAGKSPLGRPRRRWVDNIRMYHKEIGTNTRNWVDSAQDRDYWRALVNAALNLHVNYLGNI